MTPQLEAIAMLTKKFTSGNGIPIDSCRISREEFRQIFEALAAVPEEPRILDEREVKAIAKKVGLARYMWDTEEGRMDLARFAHESAVFMNNDGASK